MLQPRIVRLYVRRGLLTESDAGSVLTWRGSGVFAPHASWRTEVTRYAREHSNEVEPHPTSAAASAPHTYPRSPAPISPHRLRPHQYQTLWFPTRVMIF